MNSRIGMMLEDSTLDAPINSIVDQLRNKHYNIGLNENQMMERDSMNNIVSEAIEETSLEIIQGGVGIPFGFINCIATNFPLVHQSILTDSKCLSYIELTFANAVGFLTQALQPSIHAINARNEMPNQLDRFAVNRECSYYVLEGVPLDHE